MDRRELHNRLLEVCPNVYYQPPSLKNIKYPHIKYNRVGMDLRNALDDRYLKRETYQLLVVSSIVDDPIIMKIIEKFPTAVISFYTIRDNLYQTTITIKIY